MPGSPADGLRFAGITRSFRPGGGGNGVVEIDLAIARGELVALVGPSGAGKSTLLRLAAGLDRPERGTISIDGADVTDRDPGERPVGMVFDDAAVYEHLDVRGNLLAGLDRFGLRGDAARTAASAAAELVGANGLLDRRPATLSAGERRRVALGRAIARRPATLLLDEPLAHLDRAARLELREDLRAIHRATGAATLLVTHDHEDAAAIADRIAFLAAGRLRQVGTALELWLRPAHIEVARGFGPVPMNLVPDRDGWIGFRAEDAFVTEPGQPARAAAWTVPGTVEAVAATLPGWLITVRTDRGRVRVATANLHASPGTAVEVGSEAVHRFAADGARRAEAPRATDR